MTRFFSRLLVLTACGASASALAATCPPDVNLGSAVGTDLAAATGPFTTCGEVNDFGNSLGDIIGCAAGQDSEDVSFVWTAPAGGTYIIDTLGSSYDTALQLRSFAAGTDCGATELACDDDGAGNLKSMITFPAAAGQTFLIVVDGYAASACGPFILNIQQDICLDDDNDGVCNDFDQCFGDDATGDADGDGFCDGLPLALTVGAIVPGQPVNVSVDYGTLTGRVYLFASLQGPGAGPCYPAAGICLDLLDKVLVGQRNTAPAGIATFQPVVPANVRPGTHVAFQAAVADVGTGVGATSPVVIRTTP